MKRAKGLDVLRGLGTLLIVIHHASPPLLPDMPKASGVLGFILWRVRNIGWTGIDLFFVLGGFFMCATIFSELDRTGRVSLGEYWKRRAARLLPSYYILLLVLVLTGSSGFVDFSQPWIAVCDVLTHVLLLNNYIDQTPNGPTWFLAAMVHFYILVPLVCTLFSRSGVNAFRNSFARIALVLIAGTFFLRLLRVVSGTHMPNDFMLTHFRLDSVLIGMLAMRLLTTRHWLVGWLREHWVVSVVVSLLLIMPAMFFPRKDPYMFTVGFSMLACGYAGLILLLCDDRLKLSSKGSAAFSFIAACSYNIYLWHYFLPALMGGAYVCLQQAIQNMMGSAPRVILAQVLVFVALSVAVGYVVTILFERPVTRLLSRLRGPSFVDTGS